MVLCANHAVVVSPGTVQERAAIKIQSRVRGNQARPGRLGRLGAALVEMTGPVCYDESCMLSVAEGFALKLVGWCDFRMIDSYKCGWLMVV